MSRLKQGVLHCPCGRARVLALGLCATCYTLKRQDGEHFGGLREAVLERDGYRCRVCDASGRDKRSIIVHHRIPGKSVLNLMISLCPACHAKVHRTKAVLSQMPTLLRTLWREQHPDGHEQTALDFAIRLVPVGTVPMFEEEEEGGRQNNAQAKVPSYSKKPPRRLAEASSRISAGIIESGQK